METEAPPLDRSTRARAVRSRSIYCALLKSCSITWSRHVLVSGLSPELLLCAPIMSGLNELRNKVGFSIEIDASIVALQCPAIVY